MTRRDKHLTSSRYLVASGFISLRDAERCTTTTCLNFLTFSLGLSRPNYSADQRPVDVGRCLYTHQPYIYDRWLGHLLAFAAATCYSSDRHLDVCLHALLRIFSRKHMQDRNSERDRSQDVFHASKMEPRLRHVEQCGDIHTKLCLHVNY